MNGQIEYIINQIDEEYHECESRMHDTFQAIKDISDRLNDDSLLHKHYLMLQIDIDRLTKQLADLSIEQGVLSRMHKLVMSSVASVSSLNNCDVCVCCGRQIPEGRQICYECENGNFSHMMYK